MGQKKEIRKRERREAAERAKRIETNLKAANATETNLLADLETSVTFDYERQQGETTEGSKRKAHISYYSSPLPKNLHRDCMELFERNMGDMYRSSSWGLNLKEKDDDFRHKNARFLVVTDAQIIDGDETKPDPTVLAFSHFRFEGNDEDKPTEEVLYLYEIQVNEIARRCGLGRRLMSIMETIAMRANMRCVMLTVFKKNQSAMDFYLHKMKYTIDESSPNSQACCLPRSSLGYAIASITTKFEGGSVDYEILSKRVSKSELTS
jgi:ribosomal protein S18 acetylase RimI-like enzyme